MHILYGEERPFGESLAFFLSVIEEGQDLCLQIIVGERFLDIGFGTYLQSLDFAVYVILGRKEYNRYMA